MTLPIYSIVVTDAGSAGYVGRLEKKEYGKDQYEVYRTGKYYPTRHEAFHKVLAWMDDMEDAA